MRILILHGYGLSGSGSAIYTRDLIRALAGCGFDVDLVCHEADLASALPRSLHATFQPGVARCSQRFGTSTVRAYALSDRDVPVMYARPELPRGREIADWSGPELDEYTDGVFSFLQRLGAQAGWDAILVNHLAALCPVAARWCREYGTPWSAVVHGTGLLYGFPHAPLRDRVIAAIESSTSVVVLNREVRVRVEAAFGDRCPPLREVPPGVDTARFQRRDNTTTGRVAFAGRLTLDKGVHHLLLAWPHVLERCPGATLHLAGAGGDAEVLRAAFDDMCRGDIRAAAARLTAHGARTGRNALVQHVETTCDVPQLDSAQRERLRNSITWRGSLGRAEVATLLGESHAAVLPAVVPEAFPLAVLEATAAGAIPVGTELSGLGWLLRQVEASEPALAGRLIARTDAPDPIATLGRTLAAIIERPALRTSMDDAPRRFAEHYEWQAIAKRLVDSTHIVPSERAAAR